MKPRFSVIIPALNEVKALPLTLASVRRELPEAEVIVVDGGSRDGTPRFASEAGATVLLGKERGRGNQCREGAEHAAGEWLLFLHADTQLSGGAGSGLRAFCERGGARAANFRLRFDEPHWFLRLSGALSAIDSVFTRFGDQGILVRATVYREVGGFPAWPLFEDVEFLRRLRRHRRLPSLKPGVITSARRFRQNGRLGQQLRNGRLLLRFLCGADPQVLAEEYRRVKPQSGEKSPRR